jgi:hypothetical protein
MLLALSTARSIRVAANMPTAWEQCKLVCRRRAVIVFATVGMA